MHSYRDAAKVSAAGRINKAKGGGIAEKVDAGPSGLVSSKSMPGVQGGDENFGNLRISGRMGGSRLDRPKFAQGGAVKKPGATVNVIVAPQGAPSAPPAAAMPPPPPMPPPMPAAPPGPPAGAGMPPMGGMMGGAPPMGSGPPMLPGRSRGGSAYAKGGKVNMDAGAGSGPGRLEKIDEYGANAKKVR